MCRGEVVTSDDDVVHQGHLGRRFDELVRILLSVSPSPATDTATTTAAADGTNPLLDGRSRNQRERVVRPHVHSVVHYLGWVLRPE